MGKWIVPVVPMPITATGTATGERGVARYSGRRYLISRSSAQRGAHCRGARTEGCLAVEGLSNRATALSASTN